MSTFDSQALAAWKLARDAHGHSLTFTQAGGSVYDVATGQNSESSGAETTVTGIICPKQDGRQFAVDQSSEVYDLIVQVLASELAYEARPGDTVEYDSTDYTLVRIVPFPFGAIECYLRGARE